MSCEENLKGFSLSLADETVNLMVSNTTSMMPRLTSTDLADNLFSADNVSSSPSSSSSSPSSDP